MNTKKQMNTLCVVAKYAIVMIVGFCSSVSALASSNVANDGPDVVVAPKAKGARLLASGQTGGTESGFAPPAPSDIQFVALMGGDLHVQKSAGETIRFPLQIDRVFGNVNMLSSCGAMPSSVVLRMRVWDVDSDYAGSTPEEDHVYVNNHFVGILSGHNETWTENTFPIPINLLNLKEDENGTGLNTIEIRVAVSGGGWVTKVDWASIYIPAPPPVVIAHGIRDSAEGISELEDAIKGLGLPAHTFSFDNGGNNGIKDGARQLGREISSAKAKFGVEHVNIVAHSMGGLKAREYAENASDVAKVLQIATPNAGAPAADLSIYGKLFDVATYGQFDKVLKKAFGISVWDGALHDLSPSYMAKYNNNKAHHLNSDVYYRVVAGAVDTWFDSALFSLGSKTYGHGEWLNGELVRGDGIVPLESAHTYIGPYDNSPVKGNEAAASHTGLVTTGARNVVEKYLKADLLEQKTTGQINNPVKMAASRSCRSTATPSFYAKPIYTVSGVINLNSSTTSISPFEIIKGHDTSIWLSLDDCDDFDIVLTSPNGARFSNSSGSVSISKEGGNAFINLPSPEIGQWQLAISAKSTSASVLNVPYVIDINEENSGVDINAWLESDNVRAGEPFHISVRPTIDGQPITGAVYANIRRSLDSQNQITTPKQLTSSSSGVYTGALSTNGEGEYDIAISVEAQVPMHFTRGAVLTGVAHSSTSTFNSNASLVAVDPDNNGLYDSLVASFGVNVSKSGTYRVVATLSDADNGTTITEAWTTNVYCAAGVSTMKVNFAGGTLYSYGECGGYVISDVRLMEIGDTYDAVVDSKANAVATTAYSFGQFEHATLAIKDGGHDVAVDMDRDGTNDCIVAIVPLAVESLASGSYQWSASLITSNGAMLAVDSGSVSLSSESSNGNTIPMTFSATYIKEHDITGPFQIGNILLWNESTGKYIALEGEYATKNAYPISTWNTATTDKGKTILFVNASQIDDTGSGASWKTAKKSIQAAIESAPEKEWPIECSIYVYDGNYEPIDTHTNALYITSVNGPHKTIIDGSLSWGRGITNRCATLGVTYSGMSHSTQGGFDLGFTYFCKTIESSLNGFSIINGRAEVGGGLYYGSVSNCMVTGNIATSKGSGAYWSDISDSQIIDNGNISSDSYGGGCYGGKIERCLLKRNKGAFGGGCAYASLNNCIVVDNSADIAGGGTYSGTIKNSTVIRNSSLSYGGGCSGVNAEGDGSEYGISTAKQRGAGLAALTTGHQGFVYNSIVWANVASVSNNVYDIVMTNSCTYPLMIGAGNIAEDPLLRISAQGIAIPGGSSPCVDSGMNTYVKSAFDYRGNPRILNRNVDMGAIEWQGYEIVNSNFTWQSGGDLKWDIDYNQGDSKLGCFVSGNISHGQQTWIETTVKGAGVITFEWKVSSEARFDTLSIYVDGVRKKYISGTVDWTTVSISIDTLANHTVKWVYSKSASGTAGDDCGWVGNVKWLPDADKNRMVLTVNSAFGNPSPSTGSNDFAWGDEVQVSVAPAFTNESARGVCKGWIGSGSAPSRGNEASFSFNITETSTVTWNWDVEYLVRVSSTAYGTVDIDNAWVRKGGSVTITATPEVSCGGFRWTGDLRGATIDGYVITIPVNCAKNITAEFLPPAYGVALGISDMELSSGGDAVWSVSRSESAYGDGASCRSGEICGQGLSYLEMTVTGPGVLSFMWKLTIGSPMAGIDLLVDGEVVDGLIEATDWVAYSYSIPSGTHVVRWEFYCDSIGQDAYACVDHVTWTGGGSQDNPSYVFSFNANGGKFSNGAVTKRISARSGNLWGKMPMPSMSGYVFDGWYKTMNGGDQDLVTASSEVPAMGATYYAHWTPRLGLAAASEWAGAFDTDSWCGQGVVSHDGHDALRSGILYDNQNSYLVTKVTGTGVLTFWWAVSCEGGGKDALRFLVDGSQREMISGEVGWTKVTIRITTPGTHTLKWNYTKNGSVSKGEDFGWVDQISWMAHAMTDAFLFDANGGKFSNGASVKKTDAAEGNLWGKMYMPARDGYVFDGWYTERNGGNLVTASDIVPFYYTTYFAHWTPRLGLAAGSEWPGEFSTDSWCGQATVTHDGRDALRSGIIYNSQNSYLITRIVGSGTITFWWKVSCEGGGNDALRFLVDGEQKCMISGETDWVQVAVDVVGPGTHILKWNYVKNSSVTKGQDFGWLDQICWILPPANVIATDGTSTDNVVITWSAVADAGSYQIWRGFSEDASAAELIGTSDTLTFTDNDATPGTQYYYFVSSVADNQSSICSTCDVGWRMLSPPADVCADDGASAENVTVTWSAASGAASYQIWRSSSADAHDASLIGTSHTLTYTDNDATPGTPYYYAVCAVANNWNSLISASDIGWRKLSLPIYTGYNEVGSWHSIGGSFGIGGGRYYEVKGYHYYYSLPSGATGFEVVSSRSGVPAADTSAVTTYCNTSSLDYYVAAGALQSYYVRAVNDFCKSDWLLIK